MPAAIIRQDKNGRNEQWILDIGNEFLTLLTPNNQVFLRVNPTQAAQCVTFPSFSKSIKYPSFSIAQRGIFQFSMHPATLQQLRDFTNRGIAARGPAVIRSVFIKALLTTIGGFLLMCFGAIALAVTIYELNTGKSTGGPHPVGFISCLLGLAIMCRGIYGFYQYTKLKRIAPPK